MAYGKRKVARKTKANRPAEGVHKHKLRTGKIQSGVHGGVTDPELEGRRK